MSQLLAPTSRRAGAKRGAGSRPGPLSNATITSLASGSGDLPRGGHSTLPAGAPPACSASPAASARGLADLRIPHVKVVLPHGAIAGFLPVAGDGLGIRAEGARKALRKARCGPPQLPFLLRVAHRID